MMNKKLTYRRRALVSIALIAVIVALVFVSKNYFGKSIIGRGEILSHITADDQRTTYSVLVFYDLSSSGFDWQRHSISNVSIVVRQSTLKDFKDAFTADYRRTWQTTNPRLPPTWADRYVPSGDFILPSGRVLLDAEGQVYFILFDGTDCSLYRLNAKNRLFEPCKRSPAIDKMLADYHEHAFDAEDVYWDFALVKCAGFFSKKPVPITFSPHIELDDLYTWWREIYWKNKPDGNS